MKELKWRTAQGVHYHLWELSDEHLKGIQAYLEELTDERLHEVPFEMDASTWWHAVQAERLRRQVQRQVASVGEATNIAGRSRKSNFLFDFRKQQLFNEACASVALDKGDGSTWSEADVPHSVVKKKYGSVRRLTSRAPAKGRRK